MPSWMPSWMPIWNGGTAFPTRDYARVAEGATVTPRSSDGGRCRSGGWQPHPRRRMRDAPRWLGPVLVIRPPRATCESATHQSSGSAAGDHKQLRSGRAESTGDRGEPERQVHCQSMIRGWLALGPRRVRALGAHRCFTWNIKPAAGERPAGIGTGRSGRPSFTIPFPGLGRAPPGTRPSSAVWGWRCQRPAVVDGGGAAATGSRSLATRPSRMPIGARAGPSRDADPSRWSGTTQQRWG